MAAQNKSFLNLLPQKTQNQNWVQEFLQLRVENYEQLLKTKPESYWNKLGEKRALQLFHLASEIVPAYKDF